MRRHCDTRMLHVRIECGASPIEMRFACTCRLLPSISCYVLSFCLVYALLPPSLATPLFGSRCRRTVDHSVRKSCFVPPLYQPEVSIFVLVATSACFDMVGIVLSCRARVHVMLADLFGCVRLPFHGLVWFTNLCVRVSVRVPVSLYNRLLAFSPFSLSVCLGAGMLLLAIHVSFCVVCPYLGLRFHIFFVLCRLTLTSAVVYCVLLLCS